MKLSEKEKRIVQQIAIGIALIILVAAGTATIIPIIRFFMGAN